MTVINKKRSKLLLVLGLALAVAVFALKVGSSGKGRFEVAPAKIQRTEEGDWQLTEDFHFVDSNGKRWTAPAGTKTDGASIPGAFLSLIGDRFSSDYLDAAVVHDAYCDSFNQGGSSYQTETWEHVHGMFFEACLTCGTNEVRAKLMYAAVYLGGPRWEDATRSLKGVADDELLEVFKDCRDWIQVKNPSKDEIEEWMKKREDNLRKSESVLFEN